MTDRELFSFFDGIEYGEGWVPKLRVPSSGRSVNDREIFTLECRANCVTDPAAIARLWAATPQGRAEAEAKAGAAPKKRGRQPLSKFYAAQERRKGKAVPGG